MTNRWVAWVALLGVTVLALAVVVAACGGDDDDQGTNGGPTSAATATQKPSGAGNEATPAEPASAETPAATELPTLAPGADGSVLVDPCSLVTPAEISEIAGEEYGEGKLNSDDCTYLSPTNREVTISVEDHGSRAKSQFEDNVDVLKMAEVDGIGDGAAWAEQFSELDVLAGEKIVIVSVPFIDVQDKQAAAIAIAKKALD